MLFFLHVYLQYFVSLAESMNTELVIQFDNAQPMVAEHLDQARGFGVELDDSKDPVTTQTFVVAYFKHLICQREKLNRGLLVDHIRPDIAEMWQKLLSSLEERNRRVVGAGHGSLTFTLFCPTRQALDQLMDETWIEKITKRLTQLLETLGMKLFSVVTQHKIFAERDQDFN